MIMKKYVLFLFLSILPFMALSAANVKTIHVTHEEGADDINTLLGSDKNTIDSLVITGELWPSDFQVLNKCTKDGKLRGINMEGCVLLNNEIKYFEYSKLNYITLPKTVEKIGNYAFYNSNLRIIELPSSVTTISQSAFDTSAISGSLIIPEGVVKIGDSAFFGCDLVGVSLPSTLRTIESNAFSWATKLGKVELKEGLETIGASAFMGTRIKELVLPESVTQIETGAFQLCTFLESVVFPSDLRVITSYNFDVSSLSNIVWPKNLEVLEKESIVSYYGNELILPDGLRDIGEIALYSIPDVSLLVLPLNLENIDGTVFTGSTENLKEVYAKNPTPPNSTVDESSLPFKNLPSDAILYVPVGSLEAYKACRFFGRFRNIIEKDYVPSAIGEVESDVEMCSVKGGDGVITIDTDRRTAYSVYAVDGRQVCSGMADGRERITLRSGLYVVKAGLKSVKVLVK